MGKKWANFLDRIKKGFQSKTLKALILLWLGDKDSNLD